MLDDELAPAPAVSSGPSDTAPRAKRPVKPRKDTVVATRLDDAGLAVLDELCRAHDLSRSEALRKVVEMIGEKPTDNISARLEAERPIVVRADPVLLRAGIDAANEVARRYGERAREIRAIGINVNQIARVANAEPGSYDADVLDGIDHALGAILDQMVLDAEADAKALRVLTSLKAG